MPIYRLSPMLNSLSHLLTCSGCSTCWLPFPCRMCVASDSAIDLCPDSVLAVNLLVVKPRNLHDYCACLLTPYPPLFRPQNGYGYMHAYIYMILTRAWRRASWVWWLWALAVCRLHTYAAPAPTCQSQSQSQSSSWIRPSTRYARPKKASFNCDDMRCLPMGLVVTCAMVRFVRSPDSYSCTQKSAACALIRNRSNAIHYSQWGGPSGVSIARIVKGVCKRGIRMWATIVHCSIKY